jgi:tRNA-splicing ligase RtcB
MIPQFVKKINDTEWEIPVSHRKDMRVPCKFIASEPIIADMDAAVFEQAVNVATLPGIINHSFCMPDGHISILIE